MTGKEGACQFGIPYSLSPRAWQRVQDRRKMKMGWVTEWEKNEGKEKKQRRRRRRRKKRKKK